MGTSKEAFKFHVYRRCGKFRYLPVFVNVGGIGSNDVTCALVSVVRVYIT